MKIVGCDLHTRYQQIAMLDEETGELIERRRVAYISGGQLLTRVIPKNIDSDKTGGCPTFHAFRKVDLPTARTGTGITESESRSPNCRL